MLLGSQIWQTNTCLRLKSVNLHTKAELQLGVDTESHHKNIDDNLLLEKYSTLGIMCWRKIMYQYYKENNDRQPLDDTAESSRIFQIKG